jgi:hypothetical protein
MWHYVVRYRGANVSEDRAASTVRVEEWVCFFILILAFCKEHISYCGLLGLYHLAFCRILTTFRRIILPPSSENWTYSYSSFIHVCDCVELNRILRNFVWILRHQRAPELSNFNILKHQWYVTKATQWIFTPRSRLARGRIPRYPFVRRLCWLQSRSGHCKQNKYCPWRESNSRRSIHNPSLYQLRFIWFFR